MSKFECNIRYRDLSLIWPRGFIKPDEMEQFFPESSGKLREVTTGEVFDVNERITKLKFGGTYDVQPKGTISYF
jgi:hypothetical protein